MINMTPYKNEIRSDYLSKRKQIRHRDKNNWDLSIFNQLINLNIYSNAKTIHLYVSNSEINEVDTIQIIHHSLLNGKKVVVPRVVNDSLLEHLEIKTTRNLKKNRWGILEPENGEEVDIDDFNVIIVPMVAGDKQRNRIGYGKGFYDRFLVKSSAFKIGLLYDLQIHTEELPVETFDIPLDLLLTQSGQI